MPVTSAPRTVRQIARKIDAQFTEQPGLRLTEPQLRRLCHLSTGECEEALDSLLEAGVLEREPTGHYRARPRR